MSAGLPYFVYDSRKKMVPKVGLEPTRHHWRQILSLVRLPFRHFGKSFYLN